VKKNYLTALKNLIRNVH